MKRERPRCNGDIASVTKIWSIFVWELCIVCKKEFRRENGWKHFTYIGSSGGITRYVCCECCPSEQQALNSVEQYVIDFHERMKKLAPHLVSHPKKPY